MTRTRKTLAVVALTLTALAGSLLLATPASAESFYHPNVTNAACPSGDFCVWAWFDESGTGAGWPDSEDNYDHTNHGSWDGIANAAQPNMDNFSWSVDNNGTCCSYSHVRAYTGYGYGGSAFCFANGVYGNLGPSWQNVFSSHRWFDGANCTGSSDSESHSESA